MINITKTFYTYQYNEFLPIYYEGELTNLDEFYRYKGKKAAAAAGRIGLKIIVTGLTVLDRAIEKSK